MSKLEKSSKYCYPGTELLINKLNIQDYDKLQKAERILHAFKMSFLNSSEKLEKIIEQSIVNHIPNRDLLLKYNSRKSNY